MNKTMMFLGIISLNLAYAQQKNDPRNHTQHDNAKQRVGVNTEKPVATFEILKLQNPTNGQVEGFMLPHLDQNQRNAMTKEALVEGLQIYNTTKHCIDWWDGENWQCTDGKYQDEHGNPWTVFSPVKIEGIGFTGNYTSGTVLNEQNVVKFRLTNTGRKNIPATDLTNAVSITNGNAHLTATGKNASAVTLAPGASIDIEYAITGTPKTGALQANFSHEGKSVSQQTTVNPSAQEIMQNISVTPGNLTGDFVEGEPMNANTFTVTLTNNGTHPLNNADLSNAVSINNPGGTNLAVVGQNANNITLQPGETKTITYTLTGTPALGTLTTNFNFLGKNTSASTNVFKNINILKKEVNNAIRNNNQVYGWGRGDGISVPININTADVKTPLLADDLTKDIYIGKIGEGVSVTKGTQVKVKKAKSAFSPALTTDRYGGPKESLTVGNSSTDFVIYADLKNTLGGDYNSLEEKTITINNNWMPDYQCPFPAGNSYCNDYLWLVVVGEEQYVYFTSKGEHLDSVNKIPPIHRNGIYGRRYIKQ